MQDILLAGKKKKAVSGTRLLMHFDNNIIDEAGAPTTFLNGQPTGTFNTTNQKFGAACYNPSANAILSLGIDDARYVTGITEATIEAWLYYPGVSSWAPLISQGDSSGTLTGLDLSTRDGHDLAAYYPTSASANAAVKLIAANTIPKNQLNHIAFTWKNGVAIGWLNGVRQLSGNMPTWLWRPNKFACVGCYTYATGYYFPGYIDELRFIDSAIYTENFTPPASPFSI